VLKKAMKIKINKTK